MLQSYQQFSPEGVLQKVTLLKKMKNKLFKTTTILPQVYGGLMELRNSVSDNFATITSQEINDKIDANYTPVEAKFIKQYYSTKMLAEVQATSDFEIAKESLSNIALVDPTGIVGLVDAFTHPLCGDLNLTFPAKPIIINGSGAPNAGVGVDGNYYVNTDANLPDTANPLYGPKKNGVWPQWVPNY
jgi:hypothetical protein